MKNTGVLLVAVVIAAADIVCVIQFDKKKLNNCEKPVEMSQYI